MYVIRTQYSIVITLNNNIITYMSCPNAKRVKDVLKQMFSIIKRYSLELHVRKIKPVLRGERARKN